MANEKKLYMSLYVQLGVGLLAFTIFMSVWSAYDFVTVPLDNKQMAPNFNPEDFHWGNCVSSGQRVEETYELEHGDVVYYQFPHPLAKKKREHLFFARVIGLPGDTVGFLHGKLIRNGKVIAEEYLAESKLQAKKLDNYPEIIVPRDHVYIVVDNREKSGGAAIYQRDSRSWGPLFMYAVDGIIKKE